MNKKIVRKDRTLSQNIERVFNYLFISVKQYEQHSFNTKFNQLIDRVRGYEYEETEDENYYTNEDVENYEYEKVTSAKSNVIQFPTSRVSNM